MSGSYHRTFPGPREHRIKDEVCLRKFHCFFRIDSKGKESGLDFVVRVRTSFLTPQAGPLFLDLFWFNPKKPQFVPRNHGSLCRCATRHQFDNLHGTLKWLPQRSSVFSLHLIPSPAATWRYGSNGKTATKQWQFSVSPHCTWNVTCGFYWQVQNVLLQDCQRAMKLWQSTGVTHGPRKRKQYQWCIHHLIIPQ